MGACCTRNYFAKDYSSIFFSNNDNDLLNEEKEWILNLEPIEFDSNEFNDNIQSLINYIDDNFKTKSYKISFVEIYNMTLLYQENYTTCKYLLYDLRPFALQKENYLKKIKRINYSNEEIINLSIDRKNNFKRFLNNHIIIIIFPSDTFENDEKKEYLNIISNLLNLGIDIKINILNTSLKENTLSPYTQKLYDFLDNSNYYLLPYVLLSYSHIINLKIEGYIFIQFDSNNFNFENFNKENQNKNNLINQFINEFYISTIIHIDNEERYKDNSKHNEKKNNIFKEYFIGWNEYTNNNVNINMIGIWIRKEIKNGHSIIFNIQNYKENSHNWILMILILLILAIPVKISQIIDYLNEKTIFINNFQSIIEENQNKLKEILKIYDINY